MQTATALVRHKGSLTSIVKKRGLTPAEVVILQRIHAPDAVVDVVLEPTDHDRDAAEEFDRLHTVYGSSKGGAEVITAAFPGSNPRLPLTFKEIGIDATPMKAPAKRARANKEEASADAAADVLE